MQEDKNETDMSKSMMAVRGFGVSPIPETEQTKYSRIVQMRAKNVPANICAKDFFKIETYEL